MEHHQCANSHRAESPALPNKYQISSFFHSHTPFNMKYFYFFIAAAIFSATIVYSSAISERAVLNVPCTGKDNAPGVYVTTSKCSSSGGTFISNACPGTPNDIKCCTKTLCSGNGKTAVGRGHAVVAQYRTNAQGLRVSNAAFRKLLLELGFLLRPHYSWGHVRRKR